MSIKSKIKQLIPEKLISFYHLCLAAAASFFYGFPSKKIIVIGVTGTKGKTSAANFIWSVLNAAGYSTGMLGTANIRIGDIELPNKYHMTMPGRFILQGLLKKMASAGCKYCIVETTSEGIKQWRHYGIYYDMAVFTNLSPEHLQAHGGSFENYKIAKGKMFAALTACGHKIIDGKKVEKIIIANSDSRHSNYYLKFPADKKITFGLSENSNFSAKNIKNTPDGLSFLVGVNSYNINILGNFNVYNALPAIVIGSTLGVAVDKIKKGLENLKIIPGRMERINEGQNFLVFVDYAHEQEGMNAVLDTARDLVAPVPKLLSVETKGHKPKIILLLGAEGGGRDKSKRPILGEIAAKKADFMIVSNVDPYEDNPIEICEDIAKSAENPPAGGGKIRNENLFVIEDRRQGINKALSLAKENDVVLITGKGAEQSIIIGGKSYPWDDRVIVREELNKILNK